MSDRIRLIVEQSQGEYAYFPRLDDMAVAWPTPQHTVAWVTVNGGRERLTVRDPGSLARLRAAGFEPKEGEE